MLERIAKAFIFWAIRRKPWSRQRIVAFEGFSGPRANRITGFWRWHFLWPDEWIDGAGKHWNRPPWWRPFNAFVHCWRPTAGYAEELHDHPRWTITICLRGELIERTPWGERRLTPGSIQIRSRKFIHGFTLPPEHRGKTWTLFIAGRRNHRQTTYQITPR